MKKFTKEIQRGFDLQLFADGDAAATQETIDTQVNTASQDAAQAMVTTPNIVIPTAAERAKMSKEDLAKLKTDLAAAADAALNEVEQDIQASIEKVKEEEITFAENFRA
ncbi:hypothetical protein Ga0466249_005365, partial [Sporomusaceae bacterium BoRhaA]|uniref:hypothetical protein n=1 Tax=Pelorhabdus rhamnosifermentans TaxID=2772457 RepID=UPI001C05F670